MYLTNAVKHFKHEVRGKRRIHQKPNTTEIVACHQWIESELAVIQPSVVVMLGTVAVRSVLGRSATISSLRGTDVDVGTAHVVVTIHPSAIMRARSDRDAMFDGLVADLRRVRELASPT